jgi:hypothetical protein
MYIDRFILLIYVVRRTIQMVHTRVPEETLLRWHYDSIQQVASPTTVLVEPHLDLVASIHRCISIGKLQSGMNESDHCTFILGC